MPGRPPFSLPAALRTQPEFHTHQPSARCALSIVGHFQGTVFHLKNDCPTLIQKKIFLKPHLGDQETWEALGYVHITKHSVRASPLPPTPHGGGEAALICEDRHANRAPAVTGVGTLRPLQGTCAHTAEARSALRGPPGSGVNGVGGTLAHNTGPPHAGSDLQHGRPISECVSRWSIFKARTICFLQNYSVI